MKVDQLWDAIEEIDDRYIEESAYGVRRKTHIPWGMICAAACFCLVIGAAMFMQSLGILPHLNGPGATTVQPTTTEPSDTTEPTDPTYILSEATVRNKLTMLFQDKNSWYYRALIDTFESPARLHLRYYFYNSREFGEGLQPTKEEMDELMAWEDYEEGKTLTILPVSKMDAVLTEVFDITVAEMESTAFAGMKYVKSIDSWCFWGLGTMEVNDNMLGFEVVKTTNDENAYRVRVGRQYSTSHDVYIQVRENHFYIVCNRFLETHAPPVVPPETTAPSSPTIPPESDPGVEEFFSDRENWQNLLILPAFADPTQFDLRPTYLRAMDGESTYATDLEHEKLASVIPGYSRDKLFRATKAQLDELMLAIFNITTDQLASDWEDNFTYLEETGCYYARLDNSRGYTVYIGRTEECDDGTILMYYALARGEEPYMVAKLQPNETGYYILSNERYVDNTGKSEDQIAMEALFGDYTSWFNRAIACEYDSPKEMSLLRFFYSGIKGENQKTTDRERQLLKEKGVNLNYDLMRLPVDKMNEVLTEYFGITLDDMEPEAFGGLVYLESTNCYYHSTSGWLGVENFEALSVERMEDGRILVRYPYRNEEYTVTLKPHGESYLILSNQKSNQYELRIAMEELFKGSIWFNQALTCEYDSPEQIELLQFFNIGFPNESKITDKEWGILKNIQGYGVPWGDIYRLPPDKMNEVLTECFGITLEDVDPTGFNGLAYLESTNCYYFKPSGPIAVNFKADRVERNADGTIDVYYSISYKGDYVVTVKPHGESYLILSNQCINSKESPPPTNVTAPTGDTELEKLFFNYEKMPDKELSQKMVDAFLADPDTFVQLLTKQGYQYFILGVLSRNVTDEHPQIGAYREAVSSLLVKELPRKERYTVCAMAVYSGLSNYISAVPMETDYRLILDAMDYDSYQGETLELLRKFCIEDAAGMIAVIAPRDISSQLYYISSTVTSASQEELEQIKASVLRRKQELAKLDGEGIQKQIECAQLFIDSWTGYEQQ